MKVSVNKDFEGVIKACSKIKRAGQNNTWITNGMISAYLKLHQLGYAKSVEVWDDKVLVVGLYGIEVGDEVFCGESMFSKISNASKIAFITFIKNSNYKIFDCQVHTSHLESLGAEETPRKVVLKYLV